MDAGPVYWEKAAGKLLAEEKRMRLYNNPEPTGIMLTWRNGSYIGHIQIPAPEYSKEVVALSKTSKPLQDGFAKAIRKLDPGRLELVADDELALTDRNHILRKLENRLTKMTAEQTAYMIANKPEIYEL